MTAPIVTLRAMRPDEFHAYAERQQREYIESWAGSMSIDAARQKAADDLRRFLPDGLDTARQRLLVAENVDGDAVGVLWLSLEDPRTRSTEMAWLHDIRVEEAHRRSGYGRAMLAAVEALARTSGARTLALNVFGHNRAATALYVASGYEIVTQELAKDLNG